MIIAVDFDGTIVKNEWPNIGKMRLFAKFVLKWLKKRGHTLILWTCRSQKEISESALFLESRGIEFDYINENPKEAIEKYNNDPRKIGADWYIDDKAGFLGWWSIPIIIWWLERRTK